MSILKKVLIGGLGALTPIIMNLMVVDLSVLLINLTLYAVIGYGIRVIILFYLGGLVAFLHKDETSPVKVFELGIVAPALITALINANQIDVPKAAPKTVSSPTGSVMFISSAYAQTTRPKDTTQVAIKTFSMPEETKIQQILRGLVGRSPSKVYFVIVGSHLKLEDAQKQVQQILEKTKEFKPEIYAPTVERKEFSVVIGANLTRIEAKQLEKKALDLGISKEVMVWNIAE